MMLELVQYIPPNHLKIDSLFIFQISNIFLKFIFYGENLNNQAQTNLGLDKDSFYWMCEVLLNYSLDSNSSSKLSASELSSVSSQLDNQN